QPAIGSPEDRDRSGSPPAQTCNRARRRPRTPPIWPAARRVRRARCAPDTRSPADTQPARDRSSLSLPVEVPLAIVRNENRPDLPIPIVRAEIDLTLIDSRKSAVRHRCLQDLPTKWRIAQGLRQPQILLLRAPAELPPMLPVMLIELAPAPKAWPRR